MSLTHKSQSALEYMMTYGWAILVIVIVAAVLYSLGIFSPASSLSFTVTGFSGFVGTQADCTPSGVLVLSLNDALGNLVFIKYANSTYNGKTFSSNVSEAILPDSSGKILILNGCVNSSNVHFSSTVTLEYTEPGQPLPGPYISTGSVTGTTSSFVQNTVANLTNSSYIDIPPSTSMDLLWSGGTHMAIVYWADFVKVYPGCYAGACITFISENEGCTEGSSGGTTNSTYFNNGIDEWNGSTAYECKSTTLFGSQSYPVPYNKWSFIVDEYTYNPSSGDITFTVCINAACYNTTGSIQGGPGFYSNPTTMLMNEHVNGKLADVQFYDSYLSQNQVEEAYGLGYAGIPPTTNGLLAWYPLDGNANDYSGNNNNGVATNVNWVSP